LAVIAVFLGGVLIALFLTRKHPPKPHAPDVVAVIVSGASGSAQQRDFEKLLKYAENEGDVLIVASARHPNVARSVSLAATGINNLEREQNQAKAEKTARQLYEAAVAPGGNVDFQRSFNAVDDIIHTIRHIHVWVAALGSMTEVAAGVNLKDPLTRGDPATSISDFRGGFVSSCSGWDLYAADGGLQPSSLAEDQVREYWRRLMRSCGGRLTAWTIHIEGFPSMDEVPPWNGAGRCAITFELEGKTLFDTDQYQLLPGASKTLYRILGRVAGANQPHLRVDGYTDSTGSVSHNQTLSDQRAQAVAAWFLAHDIDITHVTVEGHGESSPVASNSTEEGRQLNRRVEVTLNYNSCSPA
jgi:outer membrane protein OmpA-like peptidoglycan-associated protein